MQPVEGRGIVGGAGRARGVGLLRQLVEPRMQFVERLAIAALALLDPLYEAAQQAFDRLLIHGARAGGRVAIPADAAMPTCFRNHRVPLGA